MEDETSTNPKAPYLPYVTFKRFLGSLKAGAIPSRIDKSLMNGYSGSIQSWLLSSLKFFDLTDDKGTPQPALEKLIETEGEARKKEWRTVFERAYKPVIEGLDLQRATPAQLNEKFGTEFSVETIKKCVSFFAAGADDAGILLADNLKPNARSTGPRKPRKARAARPAVEDAGGGMTDLIHSSGAGKGTSATMLLDEDGARKIVLHGPPHITPAELKRLKSWVTFQFIVKADSK